MKLFPRLPIQAEKTLAKDWIESLKNISGKSGVTVDEAKSAVLNYKSGIPALDEVIRSIKISNANGVLLLDDKTIGQVIRVFNKGDLESILKLFKFNIPITASEQTAFRKLINETPEAALHDLEKLTVENKKLYPEYDVTLDNLDKLSNEAKSGLKKIESSMYSQFKKGAVITLTLGAAYLGTDWIINTTKERTGCFMVTVIGGKTSSCKVSSFTCLDAAKDSGAKCKNFTDGFYNLTIILLSIVELDHNNKLYKGLASALGYNPNDKLFDLSTKVHEIVTTKFDQLKTFWAKSIDDGSAKSLTINPCSVKHPDIENGIIPPCRMCDTTASPTSTKYIDASQLAYNITFQCVPNPSLLDTITDVVATTGVDIFKEIKSTISGSFKYIGLGLLLLTIIAIIVFCAFKFFGTKQNVTDLELTEPLIDNMEENE